MAIPQLATPRLMLRAWRDSDRDACAAMNADPDVMEHFPAVLDRAASDALVGRLMEHWTSEGFGLWAVERLEDGRFLGFVGLMRPLFPVHGASVVEVGWRLVREAWVTATRPRLRGRLSSSASRRSASRRSCRSPPPRTSARSR